MEASVVVPVASGVGAFLTSHVLVWRVAPSNAPRIGWLAGLALMGMAVSAAVAAARGRADVLTLCSIVWIELLAVIGYLFVYAGIARSVSVTLLARLLSAGKRPVALPVLVEEYAASSRFDDRIGLMDRGGLVRVRSGSVALTPRGRRLARLADRLSRVVSGGLEG